MKVLGIAGSIRKKSFNRQLLELAAADLRALGCEVRLADIAPLPHMNEDLEVDGRRPPEVEAFRADLEWADALVVATPEYNNAVPGVLKNAIDWGSRTPNLFSGKVVVVAGAAAGPSGTALAQRELRQILMVLNVLVVTTPFVYVPHAYDAFDEAGALLNAQAATNLKTLVGRLVEVAGKLTG